MIAQDAMYHPNCLLTLYNKANSKSSDVEINDEKELHGIVLAELAAFIEQERDREAGTRLFKMIDLADL